MVYFTQKDLSNVTRYKGGTTLDPSLIYKFIVSPLCAKLVSITPSWVAPNAMTLGGFLCNIVSLLLALTYFPTLREVAPSWVYFALAFLMLTYMLLDNMDGKQSVRTGSSSPLGELLDHGVDSFTVGLGALVTAGVVQAGHWAPMFVVAPGVIAFYLAHWQEYFIHYLNLGLMGPTEAETAAIILYVVTGVFGPHIWTQTYQIGSFLLKGYEVVLFGAMIGAIYTIVTCFWEGLRLAREKAIPLPRALSQLIPFTVTWIFGFLWVYSSPQLYEAHPYLFITVINLIFSYLVISCIVQRICDLPYSYYYFAMTPFILASINSFIASQTGQPLMDEEKVLYLVWTFYFFQFLHFASEIVTGFCKQLRINFLTIPYPNKGTRRQ